MKANPYTADTLDLACTSVFTRKERESQVPQERADVQNTVQRHTQKGNAVPHKPPDEASTVPHNLTDAQNIVDNLADNETAVPQKYVVSVDAGAQQLAGVAHPWTPNLATIMSTIPVAPSYATRYVLVNPTVENRETPVIEVLASHADTPFPWKPCEFANLSEWNRARQTTRFHHRKEERRAGRLIYTYPQLPRHCGAHPY